MWVLVKGSSIRQVRSNSGDYMLQEKFNIGCNLTSCGCNLADENTVLCIKNHNTLLSLVFSGQPSAAFAIIYVIFHVFY